MKHLFLITLFFLSGCALLIDDEPWIEDDYFFNARGDVRRYEIKPEAFTRPEVALIDNVCVFPTNIFSSRADGKPTFEFVAARELACLTTPGRSASGFTSVINGSCVGRKYRGLGSGNSLVSTFGSRN